ncbi:MAG: DUF5666 domain-containing protein [Anaerolineales bacterium]
MKKVSRIFVIIVALTAMLLSACGAASAVNSDGSVSAVGGGKGNASPVQFTGIIEAINGNQWTVDGRVITVDPSVIRDGAFKVGDQVKVEVQVQTDGSVVVTRVETPDAPVAGSTDVPTVPSATDDSLSTPEITSTPDPTAGIVFDNSGNEAFGTVDSFDGTTITIGGQSFTVANGAEIKDTIVAGSFVKVEFILNPDGTVSIREIKLWDPTAVSGDNSNGNSGSDDSVTHDQNDDNGNDGSNHDQNDDNGNDGSNHDQNDDNSGSDGNGGSGGGEGSGHG